MRLPESGQRKPHQPLPQETDALLSGKGQVSFAALDCEKQAIHTDSFDFSFGMKGFLDTLHHHYGAKLLWLLFSAQFLVKGFARDFLAKSEPYIYKMYHVDASQRQVYSGVTQMPWAMKPMIGLVSDMFPIGGYNKKPYILVVTFVSVAACVLVGCLAPHALPQLGLVICLFFISLQNSTVDLLSEAKYAEKIREIPSKGSSLVSYVWFGLQAGGLVGVGCAGPLIASLGSPTLYLIALPAIASIFIPVALNYMEETKLSESQVAEVRARFLAQGELIVLCVLMIIGTSLLTLLGLFSTTKIATIASLLVAIVLLIAFSVLLNPVIAKFNAFALIQTMMSFSSSGASFYFYTDTPEQYPEGPHFSPVFYNTVVGVVTYAFALVGIYTYQRFMSTWKYRHIFIVTNFAYAILCIPDVLLFSRVNVKLGIPDHVFMLGATVAENTSQQWKWMPSVVILSYLCPKGMEATMYALLAGCANLGNTIAANCGALMLEYLGCNPSGKVGESGKFDNLWIASALGIFLPFITVLSLIWLVPDARQNEAIIGPSTVSATAGSPWERWTGKNRD